MNTSPVINHRYQQQLELLLMELITCWQRPQREEMLVSSAFLLTQKHCTELKAAIWGHGFADDESEIHFFKHLLPQFSGRMMYYTIVYEALLSCPKNIDDIPTYWEKEKERYQRFAEKHGELIRYHACNSTEADAYYYLRKNKENILMPSEKQAFSCCSDATLWSGLTCTYFAEESYRQFVESRTAQ